MVTFLLLGLASIPSLAEITLNKPVECHTVYDIISELVDGKEKNSAVLLCRMDAKDPNSTEEVTAELTTNGQLVILTALYAGNRPLFENDALVSVATFVRSANGDLLVQKLNASPYSLD